MMSRYLACSLLLMAFALSAQAETLSGEQVYEKVCKNCHGSKVPRAPQLGDIKAWKPLIREGQVLLTIEGWMGVRAMPPRGGQNDLSLQEFADAVVFMARAGGAHWTSPDEAMMKKLQAEETRRKNRQNKAR